MAVVCELRGQLRDDRDHLGQPPPAVPAHRPRRPRVPLHHHRIPHDRRVPSVPGRRRREVHPRARRAAGRRDVRRHAHDDGDLLQHPVAVRGAGLPAARGGRRPARGGRNHAELLARRLPLRDRDRRRLLERDCERRPLRVARALLRALELPVVGISLLTLVPGVVGGSETYARELVRALARVGELDYRVFVPTIAVDAADGLPSRVVTSYPAGHSSPRRAAAMAFAAAAPWPVRRQLSLGELDAIHFPLSVMLPPVSRPPAVTTVLDVQHELYPRFFSRAELAYRRVVYGWTVRRSRIVITISEHAARGLVERLRLDPSRVRPIHLGLDHGRFRPDPSVSREAFLLYPALP